MSPREKVKASPACACHWRPKRPRPAVCDSATSNTGSVCPARARRISSELVEFTSFKTSTVKAGIRGTQDCQMSSAGQIMVLSYQSKLVDVCHYFCYQRLVLALFLLVFARLVFIRLTFAELFFTRLDGRRGQQGAAAFFGAAPTRVFGL